MLYARPDPRLQALRNIHNDLIDQLIRARQNGDKAEVQRLKAASDASFQAFWAANGGMVAPIRSTVQDGVVVQKRGRPIGSKNLGKKVEPVKRGRGRPKGSKNRVKK